MRLPGYAGLLLAVCVGRLASGLIPFGLLAVFVQTNSFMSAGVVSVCFMLASSFSAPWRGRLIDQHSAHRMLPRLALAASVTAVAGFAVLHAGGSSLLGAALVCVGALFSPANGAVLRSIWSSVAPDESHRKALHALDSVLEESVYVLSPLLVGSLWFTVGPDWAILAGSSATVLGTGLLFWFARRAGDQVWAQLMRQSPPKGGKRGHGPMSAVVFTVPGLSLAVPMFGFAMAVGAGSITFAAWSAQFHVASLAGLLAGLGSLGGVVGGFLYGKAAVSDAKAAKLYLWMPAFVGLSMAPLMFSSALWVAMAVALCSGLVMTPMFIAAYVRVPASFPQAHFNEANASIGAAYNLGSGTGSLVAGALVEHCGLLPAFLVAVAMPLGATALSWLLSRRHESACSLAAAPGTAAP
ncbi:transporter [Roseateles sp. YR242]|uniref:transporter n=1 Tax=Roseateles sp. YR242 TaxID=1855305 RepID=UPI0021018643|nr:transporter [Roseateles sp. YR242]